MKIMSILAQSSSRSGLLITKMTPDTSGRVQLINEPDYVFGSADNSRHYKIEVDLTEGCRPSSIHGVIVDDKPIMVIGDAGGASGIHAHSLLVLESSAYFAVGAHVVRLTLGNQNPDWILKTDDATCFGVYYNTEHGALISHGELSICRFSREGRIIWSQGGVDIFSGSFTLLLGYVEAIDFNQKIYHFDYSTGEARAYQGDVGNNPARCGST